MRYGVRRGVRRRDMGGKACFAGFTSDITIGQRQDFPQKRYRALPPYCFKMSAAMG